jgi:hypothetical protein
MSYRYRYQKYEQWKEAETIVVTSGSDVLHVASRLIFITGLVAANGAHFVVVIIVLV